MKINCLLRASLSLLVLFSLASCVKNEAGPSGTESDSLITFVVGNDVAVKSGVIGDGAYVQSIDLEDSDISIVETVTSMDAQYSEAEPETKGTPIYTENFDALYGEQFYATAYEPKAGARSKMTDIWGSYRQDGGVVKFEKTAPHTYSYNYSIGPDYQLAWPDGGSLLYFLQAPFETTNALRPEFYSDGSIEFDYTDPTSPTTVGGRKTIVNGAASQRDILFTSKDVAKPAKAADQVYNTLMYHALTAVKFKVGNEDPQIGQNSNPTVVTKITKVTLKGIKANGHCTVNPNYTDANTIAGENPSNENGAATSKSAICSTWGSHSADEALIVDYSQEFGSATVDYSSSNSSFGDSFYDGASNVKNLVNKDGSEVMLMVPQTLSDVEVVVDFTVDDVLFSRSVKMSGVWKAGELHTYTLTVNKVSVAVDDEMNKSLDTKDNVTTANSGNVTAYLRAQVATAWYYGYGDDAVVVAAYLGNGWFYNGDEKYRTPYSIHWIKGEDGYYYYKYPVLPGKSTSYKLFGRYEAPQITEKAPFPGAHLEMKIILQGVQFDGEKAKVDAAWGDVHTVDGEGLPTTTTVVSQLSTIPEGSTN